MERRYTENAGDQMASVQDIERHLGDWLRARLPIGGTEFIMFGVKMGWASLFGGLLLIGLIVSNIIWQADWPIARYDALVIYAVVLQVAFLVMRLETLSEAKGDPAVPYHRHVDEDI